MATKTINLTGAKVAVPGLDGAHIKNDDIEVIYTFKTTGADKTIFILVENRGILYDITS